MAGYEMSLLAPTFFDLTNVVTTQNTTLVIPLVQRIDLSRYEYATFGIRLHPNSGNYATSIGANNTIGIYVGGDGFTPDDPMLVWTALNSYPSGNPVGGGVVSTLNSTSSVPKYDILTLAAADSGIGLMNVFMMLTRGASATAGVKFTLSLDLALRSGSGNGGFRPGAYMGYGGRGV